MNLPCSWLRAIVAAACLAGGGASAQAPPARAPSPASEAQRLNFEPLAQDRLSPDDPVQLAGPTAEALWAHVLKHGVASGAAANADKLKAGGAYAPLGRDCFIVLLDAVYQACLRGGTLRQLTPAGAAGQPVFEDARPLPNSGFWTLVTTGGLRQGIASSSFHALVFLRQGDGSLSVKATPLLAVDAVASEDMVRPCGDPASIMGPRLGTARQVRTYTIDDLDGDGNEDIFFLVAEQDCRTSRTRDIRQAFHYAGGGFVRQPPRPMRAGTAR
jgi:hypothetical protein